MKKFLSAGIAAMMAVGLAGCGSSGAAAATASAAGSAAAAGDAGKLVVYSPNTDDLINATIPAFEKATGVKVEVISGGTGDLQTRIDSEKANPQGDIMFGGMNAAMYVQYGANFEEYTSPNDTLLPTEYQNYKGVISHYCLDGSAALLVNTDVFKTLGLNPDDFKSYNDLLNPALKGQIAMGDPANSSSAWAELTNMLLVMGKEKYDDAAWEWVTSFIKNLDGKVLDSSSKVYKGVADGEYAVGVSYEDPCVSLLVDGATNLKLVYPSEGAVWLPAGVAIIKGAPNEENAKKFIDFLLSDEGQNCIASTTARPANTKINNTTELMTPFSDIKVAYEDIDYCAEHKSEWQQKWTDIFTSSAN
jgi:iron(III) transport system substrate-binding protein